MKKNKLILLSMLGAMATPLAIQPAQASSAVEMRMKALEQQKKEEEAAKAKAASEAQAAKQKKMSSVVAVENKDVQNELNALISDINSNLGSGLKVVATADKDGLKAGVKEIDKALKTAVAEKKALEAELAKLKTDVEDLVKSINAKSTKNIAMPADDKPATLSTTLKLADADVKGLAVGGAPVNLATLQGDIDALIKSYNLKHTKAIGVPGDDKPATLEASVKALDADLKGLVLGGAVNLKPLQTEIDKLIASLAPKTGALLVASIDDTPAEMINAVKAADAEVNKLASSADMTAIKNQVGTLIASLNAHSGKGLAAPVDNKPATINASLNSADTDLKALVIGGGGLPAGFAADVGHVNTELAKVLGKEYDPGTMNFKATGADFKNSVDAFVAKIGTLPANFQTIVKPDGGAPTTVLGFYGAVEGAIDTLANGTGVANAKLGGSAASANSGLGKLKLAMDLHKVKL